MGERRAATLLMAVTALVVFVLVEVWAWQEYTDNTGNTAAAAGTTVAAPSPASPAGLGPVDVSAGTLRDPYSGQTISGPTRDLDVDHVIPLALAHRTGAHSWSAARREEFANDPDNLRATTATINRSKSDHGPEHWMPPVDACAYAHDFVRIAYRYQLTVTAPRAAALQQACA